MDYALQWIRSNFLKCTKNNAQLLSVYYKERKKNPTINITERKLEK